MINIINGEIESFKFPCGEVNVKVDTDYQRTVDVEFVFEGSDSIMELLLACDAIKRQSRLGVLHMDYVPFGRQDRVMNDGEALSLKVFCDLINGLGFKCVRVLDPHSDVTTALINNCHVTDQIDTFAPEINVDFPASLYYLISPDGGALKKIYGIAKATDPLGVIECTKERDVSTGDIKRTIVHHHGSLEGVDCIIVDDICDGGRTFIEIAKVLRSKGCGNITLCVTHGFFTKGIEVFDGLIDNIYTKKGKIK